MKYTVTINEKSKSVTVDLDGYKGTAKCCPTDSFNITTGIELALERAKVAKANASKSTPITKSMGVMELVKALEKALPKGQVVLVGNGEGLTKENKAWLRSLIGDEKCCCHSDNEKCCCHSDNETHSYLYDLGYDDGYERGKDEGYDEGYAEGYADAEDTVSSKHYDEGYEDGYSDGYDVANEECSVDADELANAIIKAIDEVIG